MDTIEDLQERVISPGLIAELRVSFASKIVEMFFRGRIVHREQSNVPYLEPPRLSTLSKDAEHHMPSSNK